MKLFLVLILLLSATKIFAGDFITIGEKHHISSQILNEEREYWVYLPPNYNNPQYGAASYPVMYLLDGELFFHTMVGIQKSLAKNMYTYMPEMIVVAIVNVNRSRDFTPTKGQLVHKGNVLYQNSGGAENFHNFLTQELRSKIDSSYRTDGYNIVNGHSFGGLYALFALLNHSNSFSAYMVHDPSLWWDQKTIYHQAEEKWDSLDLKGINLYVSMANPGEGGNDRLLHSEAIQLFCKQILSKPSKNGLRKKWEYFEKEDHGTIFLPASYNALKFIYHGCRLPVKEIPENPDLISKYYLQVSQNLNHQIIPGELMINNIGNYCISMHQFMAAKKVLEYNLNNYPDSFNAHVSLAKLCCKQGVKQKAVELYQQALKINPQLGVSLKENLDSLGIQHAY